MSSPDKKYIWHTQRVGASCVNVNCPPLDPDKDFKRDPSGHYVLIRPDFIQSKIELAVCDAKHVIVAVFTGAKAQDVYEGLFRYEEKQKRSWFKSKGHAAYIGKELKKAEIALTLGQNNYYQE